MICHVLFGYNESRRQPLNVSWLTASLLFAALACDHLVSRSDVPFLARMAQGQDRGQSGAQPRPVSAL